MKDTFRYEVTPQSSRIRTNTSKKPGWSNHTARCDREGHYTLNTAAIFHLCVTKATETSTFTVISIP